MAYSFQGISTMSSALRAFQTQLDTTGDNIANAETAGYSRRTVTLSQEPSTTVTAGKTVSIGNGVNVTAVSRVRDMFLSARRDEAASKLGRGQQSLTGLEAIQASMMEPGDEGVSAAYDAFQNSWSSLSASPGDVSAKADVQAAGMKLVSKISNFAASLQSQRADAVSSTKDVLGQIDEKAKKIAQLNTDIATATAHGVAPNDLLDQRDTAVQELSKMADVSVSKGENGYNVTLNGFQLVTPSGAKTVSDKYDATTGRIVEGSSSFGVNGGTLAGARDTLAAIDATSARLDTFADTLRTQVNGLFSNGKTADGTTGGTFFAEPTPPATATGALGLRLSDAVAANPSAIASGTSGLSGDGTLAAQIAALRDVKVPALGNQTMGGFYSNLVSDVGRQVASTEASVNTQEAVVDQIDAQISSTTGVSMDDEMANLLRFQRSYQAAAKALSTFDSMSETIINMLNR